MADYRVEMLVDISTPNSLYARNYALTPNPEEWDNEQWHSAITAGLVDIDKASILSIHREGE